MTDPTALIAARRASAERTKAHALKVLAAMIRRREPVTFAAVAMNAGVSREYLYRTPELATKIKASRDTPHLLAAPEPIGDAQPIVAALRDHMRRMESEHTQAINQLRNENRELRRQLESALGQLIS